MCGRIEYVVTSKKQLEERYGATMVEGYTLQGVINARYNVPPSTYTPIITSEDSESIQLAHWGYLPEWMKETGREVINARAETVFQKPFFRKAIHQRRCLIPVTGFFEWQRAGAHKVPYRFYTDEPIFSLAGVYAMHQDKTGRELPHFAILTTAANSVMAPVHDRMPVVIDHKDEEAWLSEESDEALTHLMRPYAPKHTHAYRISTLINNPRNDSPEVIKQVAG